MYIIKVDNKYFSHLSYVFGKNNPRVITSKFIDTAMIFGKLDDVKVMYNNILYIFNETPNVDIKVYKCIKKEIKL